MQDFMSSIACGDKKKEGVPVDTIDYLTRRKVAEVKEQHLMKTKKE
jgi:hypothetical protein